MTRPALLAFFTIAVAFSSQGQASSIYADGLTHTISGGSPDIILSNATTLDVQTGASIVGATGTSQAPSTAGVSATANSPVNVTGGSITGGSSSNFDAATGLSAVSTSVNISGGTMTGGSTGGGNSAGNGLLFSASANALTISGGTFQGGNGGFGGDGAEVILSGPSASASISGGQFSAGTPAVSIFAGRCTIFETNHSTTTISGGQFSGGFVPGLISMNLADNSTVTFMGTNFTSTPISLPGIPNLQALELTGKYADGSRFSAAILVTNPFYTFSATGTSVTITGFNGIAATPEPASLILFATGLLGVAGLARSQRRAG